MIKQCHIQTDTIEFTVASNQERLGLICTIDSIRYSSLEESMHLQCVRTKD